MNQQPLLRRAWCALAMLICFYSTSILSAQTQDSANTVSTQPVRQYFVDIGYNFSAVNMSGLNQVLTQYSYPNLGDVIFALSISNRLFYNRWVYSGGVDVGLLLPSANAPRSNNRYSSSTWNFGGFAGVGYAVVEKENFSLYPMLDIGMFVIQARFTERTTLAQVLSSPSQSRTTMLQIFQIPIRVSLGADYRFNADLGTGTARYSVALQAGYNFGSNRGLELDGVAVLPQTEGMMNLSGVFAKITLGYQIDTSGWFVEKK